METMESLWTRLWSLPNMHQDMFELLMKEYAQDGRHYHTLRHIYECLMLFYTTAEGGCPLSPVPLAIWFHDIVYNPKASNNEAESAEIFAVFAKSIHMSPLRAGPAHKIIIASSHQKKDYFNHPACDLMLDIDLSSLGKTPDLFDEDALNIRKEFVHLSDQVYSQKKKAFFNELLARKSVYRTPDFREMFEKQARANMERAIRKML